MKRLIWLAIACLSVVVLRAGEVSAQEDLQLDAEDEAYIEKSRTKAYPGGLEEGSLRVQAVLISPIRKINPVKEFVGEQEADDGF